MWVVKDIIVFELVIIYVFLSKKGYIDVKRNEV